MLCSSSKKVMVCFTIISNLAVTTHVSVNNVRADLFLKGIFITENEFSLHGDWKITLSLQIFKLLSTELTKRVLNCIDFLPRKGRTQTSFFSKAFRTTFFFTKSLPKYFLIQKSLKLLGQQVVFIWPWNETSKVGKNSAEGRFAVNWSHEFVIVPSYFDVKKRNAVFIFSLRSEFDVFVLTI